ncbi:uncharacterized protein [Choristoneura fumiferana]|uniref:uncharacterized protein n=1 Tax=Choristoneura fumiferana TaxID=7141 RepID=UPI003D157547
MYYLGQTKGLYGVGFLVKRIHKEKIISFTGISERVCVLEMELENTRFAIIQAYAPTEKSSQEEIDNFYKDLEKAHDSTSTKNTISMGDFNAQIGTPKKYESSVTGKYGYGKRNVRGQRLIQYAQENNLKIINTMFKLKPKNRWTWISPDKNTKNEIDYIMTTKPHIISKYEVLSSFPFGSDHRLLRATIQLKQTRKSRRNFSNQSRKLKTADEQETYLKNLNSCIPELITTHSDYNVEDYYQKIVHCIKESLKNIEGAEKRKILSEKALELMKERSKLQNKHRLNKTDKENLKTLYKLTNKEVRKCYDTYRTNIIQLHLEKSRSAKKAYKELNKSTTWISSLQPGTSKCKSRTEIIKIATDFYSKLYSHPDITKQSRVDNAYHSTDTRLIQQFSESEILKQLTKLKPEKSPGPDGITNEHLKTARAVLLTPITILWNKILEEETVPHQWKESEIILLYKKGDAADIGNYRPISLMSCLYKLFASCLLDRISSNIDAHQPIEQAGFRSGFSTVDHIQVVDQVKEKYIEFHRPLYMAFIDYKKAFDSISHESIWEALESLNIKGKYINILKNIYGNSTSRVKLDRVGTVINIKRGVRQGDPISPKLFIAVLQHVMGNLPWSKRGIDMNGDFLSHLRFADDIILFSECPQQLNKMINELNQASSKVGLEMNLEKTKVMTNHHTTPILINNIPLEFVEKYIYLGKQISFNKDNNLEEVERRVAITWKKYWAHKEIFKSQLPLSAKKIVMDTTILPSLTYGCQTWTIDTKTKNKIQTTQRRMERSSMGLKLKDKVRNDDIRKNTKVTDALTFVLKSKWKWAGHVARYEDKRWTRRAVEWPGPPGKRARGRPHAREASSSTAMTKALATKIRIAGDADEYSLAVLPNPKQLADIQQNRPKGGSNTPCRIGLGLGKDQ